MAFCFFLLIRRLRERSRHPHGQSRRPLPPRTPAEPTGIGGQRRAGPRGLGGRRDPGEAAPTHPPPLPRPQLPPPAHRARHVLPPPAARARQGPPRDSRAAPRGRSRPRRANAAPRGHAGTSRPRVPRRVRPRGQPEIQAPRSGGGGAGTARPCPVLPGRAAAWGRGRRGTRHREPAGRGRWSSLPPGPTGPLPPHLGAPARGGRRRLVSPAAEARAPPGRSRRAAAPARRHDVTAASKQVPSAGHRKCSPGARLPPGCSQSLRSSTAHVGGSSRPCRGACREL